MTPISVEPWQLRELIARVLEQAYLSAGADTGFGYLLAPVTTGPRELDLMKETGTTTKRELIEQHRDRWLNEVLAPNEADMERFASRARQLHRNCVVPNTGRIDIDEICHELGLEPIWQQPDYGKVTTELVGRHATVLIACPNWAFSGSALKQVKVGLEDRIRIVDLDGYALAPAALVAAAVDARVDMKSRGFDDDQIDAYLRMSPAELAPPPARPSMFFGSD